MIRRIISVILFAILATQAVAQGAVPDRRQVVTLDTDFFGADLQPLFDTTREACRKACISDTDCKAYTFNTRSNACFPKSDVQETQAYDGAVSARILNTPVSILAQADDRRTELRFLSQGDINNARTQAEGIGTRHPGGQYEVGPMLKAARERIADEDYLNAMRWTGAIVAATGAADQWAEYGRLSLLIKTDNNSEKRRYATQAFQASVNAYLRGQNDGIRVSALMQMATALERISRGRDMVHALRLAESIQPRDDVVSALDAAIAKYGFRVSEHRSDMKVPAHASVPSFPNRWSRRGWIMHLTYACPMPGWSCRPKSARFASTGCSMANGIA